jgi:hypothetical protein
MEEILVNYSMPLYIRNVYIYMCVCVCVCVCVKKQTEVNQVSTITNVEYKKQKTTWFVES